MVGLVLMYTSVGLEKWFLGNLLKELEQNYIKVGVAFHDTLRETQFF